MQYEFKKALKELKIMQIIRKIWEEYIELKIFTEISKELKAYSKKFNGIQNNLKNKNNWEDSKNEKDSNEWGKSKNWEEYNKLKGIQGDFQRTEVIQNSIEFSRIPKSSKI